MFGFNFPDQHLEYHKADLKFIRDIINDTWRLDRAHVTDDYDKSIQALSKYIDVKVHEHPCGREIGMWIVPPKWTVKKGVLKDSKGKIIADYHRHPLELWTYSDSFMGELSLKELKPHLWSNPKFPNAIASHPRLQSRHSFKFSRLHPR